MADQLSVSMPLTLGNFKQLVEPKPPMHFRGLPRKLRTKQPVFLTFA